ncbi:MAG: hypothetical protein HDS06_07555 [Bacteroides sp.]|nr:hypothetical protein [Bacteroides sp.]
MISKFHRVSACLVAAVLCWSFNVSSKTLSLSSSLTEWFLSDLNGDECQPFSPDKKIKVSDIPATQKMVWDAWKAANIAFEEEKLNPLRPITMADNGVWPIPSSLEEDAEMKYYWGSKGKKPDNGYPLFLYLHGSGEPAQEWQIGLYLAKMFEDSPSAYFVPRIPRTGEYYRWWQKGKQYAWEKLLRQALVSDEIDPDRIYFFGISEGGYGSQRLASFYADYLAAAGPMAGGEPLANAPVENCRNIAFSLRTGDRDYGFYRDKLTRYTKEAFDSLQRIHPDDYIHNVELIPGMGHQIDYRLTTPWLAGYKRNPYPTDVSWEDFEMDGIHRTGFYNLQVIERPDSSKRTRYEMSIHDNVVTISVDNVEYRTIETDSEWGIPLKFERSYSPATSGIFKVYLNNDLVELTRPVKVVVNGKLMFSGKLKCTLDNMVESCREYHDPRRIFPASVNVDISAK